MSYEAVGYLCVQHLVVNNRHWDRVSLRHYETRTTYHDLSLSQSLADGKTWESAWESATEQTVEA